MTMNQKISFRILYLINQGMKPGEALDAVCGAGTFERLAGEVYDTLRAQTEQPAA